MRSKDNEILASMLTSFEARVISELEDVKSNVTLMQTGLATVTANQIAATNTHNTFRNELLSDGGRVHTLEQKQKSQDMWNKIQFLVILPITLTIHKVMTALGFRI
jgi:hypothetical protein